MPAALCFDCTMALGVTEAMVSTTEAFWKSRTTWGLSGELATVGALLVVTLLVLYFRAQAQGRNCLPPGPRPWPLVGNLLLLASGNMPHRVLERLAAKYGAIMYLRLGSRPCVVISTAAAAKEMFRLSNDAIFSYKPKGLFVEVITDNYKNPSSAPYGPHWRQLRKFSSSELFSPKRHASYQGARQEELRNMMTILVEQSGKSEAINVKSWLFELTANVMTRMLINRRYFGRGGACQEESDEMRRLIDLVVHVHLNAAVYDFIPSLSFLTKLLGKNKEFKDLRDHVLRVVGKMIELEKHRERAKERGDDDEHYVPDFVDMMSAESLDNGKPLPDTVLSLIIFVRLQLPRQVHFRTRKLVVAASEVCTVVMDKVTGDPPVPQAGYGVGNVKVEPYYEK